MSDTIFEILGASCYAFAMGRALRLDVGGYAYRVLNRSVGRRLIFTRESDFVAFERVLAGSISGFNLSHLRNLRVLHLVGLSTSIFASGKAQVLFHPVIAF